MNWYLKVLKQYADFNGRARRKEYWMFFLFHIIALFVALAIDVAIGTGLNEGGSPVGFIYAIYAFGTFIPTIAVVVRRLHDVGKSGWWYFIAFVPIIGGIWLLVLMCTDSEDGTNEYGPNPKNPSDELNEIGVAE